LGVRFPPGLPTYQVDMKKLNSDTKSKKDIFFFLVIALLTIGAFGCTYAVSLSTTLLSLVWILWLILVLPLGYLTTQGQALYAFAREARVELLKVVWPTRQETVQTTFIVAVMVTITGFLLWGVDSVMMWFIAKITQLG
jgi:preprotein translocase subunit SecE